MKPTIEQIDEAIIKQKELAGEFFAGWYEEEISFALRVLKRLMEGPSRGMDNAGYKALGFNDGSRHYETVFKSMRDQLFNEVENAPKER